MTISRKFAVTQHVDNLLVSCAQTLFALRTLRQHGLPTSALRSVFEAPVVAKLCYASPAWWGFAGSADRNRLESLLRRSARFGYRDASAQTLSDICDHADDKLFDCITRNDKHLLYPLLPQERSQHYSLRQRSHNYQLAIRTLALNDCNFITRMLFKDIHSTAQSTARLTL